MSVWEGRVREGAGSVSPPKFSGYGFCDLSCVVSSGPQVPRSSVGVLEGAPETYVKPMGEARN